jgi:hypothetical protein
MTQQQFNEKYKNYIKGGFVGLEFDNPETTGTLDEIFQDLIKIPGFEFYQIKWKFNNIRFYSSLGHALNNAIERVLEDINGLG